MRIAVVHNAVDPKSSPDDQDVLVQVEAISGALTRLGHEPVRLACDLNLDAIREKITAAAPQLVFNLVESLAGTGRLINFFPSLLDAMGVPYTGAPAEALFLTSNKILAKRQLHGNGLPTPAWVGPHRRSRLSGETPPAPMPLNWIIKSVWEHASIGIDETALVDGTATTAQLYSILAERASRLGGDCFAEAFIQGREFNLALLDSPTGPVVLPPAEIIFKGYEENRPRIVGYEAKWESGSFAYHHTPRSFEFDDTDHSLLNQLRSMTARCWDIFELCGYARVDFRVDTDNRPFVLEVNTNPCLSPDAGFAAAVQQAGLTFDEAVARIVAVAFSGRDTRGVQA